jgi:hypothetical protein
VSGAANFQAFQFTGQAFQAPRPKDNVFHRQKEIIALHTLSPQWEMSLRMADQQICNTFK